MTVLSENRSFWDAGALFSSLLFWTLVYLLPTFLGYRKPRRMLIVWVNLLLGWTVIGWLIALLWALKRDTYPDHSIEVTQKKFFRELDEFQEQYARQQLTQEEYQTKRQELIARQANQ